jgi:hypothetical protein
MLKPRLTLMTGFRPIIHARQGRMLSSRNPLDGPAFDTLEDAITFTISLPVQGCLELLFIELNCHVG